VPWLQALGIREAEARIAVRRCRDMVDAPLEDRVKRALSCFGARIGRKVVPAAAAAAPATCASLADTGGVHATDWAASP
jgi:hypothetical protein